jgi:Mg/Co/Ni transporter MgtE
VTYYRKYLKSLEQENYTSLEDFYRKNRHRLGTVLERSFIEYREDITEQQKKELIDKMTRSHAEEAYKKWLEDKRESVLEQWKDRLMESGFPNLTEIVGLANIAQALGYRENTLRKNKATKERLASKNIIYKGPDNKWRALEVACIAYREGKNKKK